MGGGGEGQRPMNNHHKEAVQKVYNIRRNKLLKVKRKNIDILTKMTSFLYKKLCRFLNF